MDITFEHIGMIALLFLTGLSAGLCFTWTNAITPGIGRLENISYLMSFQQMNRVIINPMFIIVFFGPSLLGMINLIVLRNASSSIIWVLIIAIAIYFSGVILVTVFGNLPLNALLDKMDLRKASLEDLKLLRNQFENKWNRLHFIRTLSSVISFLLVILTFLAKK